MAKSKVLKEYQLLISSALAILKESSLSKKTILTSKESSSYFEKLPKPPVSSTSFIKKETAPFVPPSITQKNKQPPKEKLHIDENLKNVTKSEHSLLDQKSKKTQQEGTQEIKPPSTSSSFKLEMLPLPSLDTMEEIRSNLQRILPEFPLYHEPQAFKVEKKETEVIIFSCKEDQKEIAFLKQLAKAIDQHLAKVKIIDALSLERKKEWNSFIKAKEYKLILVNKESFAKLTHFKPFYKQTSSGFSLLSSSTPIVLLSSASSYLQDSSLKASLWSYLCKIFQ